MTEKRTLLILAMAEVEDDDLSSDDVGVHGIYAVDVPADLPDSKAASVALDGFHSKIAVETLEDFSFSVLTIEGAELEEDPDHESYSGESLAKDVCQISLEELKSLPGFVPHSLIVEHFGDDQPGNTKFEYMYRDGANYKHHGSIILEGEFTPEQRKRLAATLDDKEFFIAHQVDVPEVFHYLGDYKYQSDDDHCWHEAEDIPFTLTTEQPTDSRSVEEFVCAFEAANQAGWEIFDPAEKFGFTEDEELDEELDEEQPSSGPSL